MADTNSHRQQHRDYAPRSCVICTLNPPIPYANFCEKCHLFASSRDFFDRRQHLQNSQAEFLLQMQQDPEKFVNNYIKLLAIVQHVQNS